QFAARPGIDRPPGRRGGRSVGPGRRSLLRDQEDRVRVTRFPRTATNIITALTALAWLIAAVIGKSEQAAFALGFIPARFHVPPVPWSAVPAILTPLSATLVHSGLVHLGFNLLMFVWCGTAVERVLGWKGLLT